MPDMAAMERKQTARRMFVTGVYNILSVGVEHPEPLSSELIANIIGNPEITQSKAKDASLDIEQAGILSRRVVYGGTTNGLKIGRNVFWKINVDLDEAMAILDKLDRDEIDAARVNTSNAMKKVAAARKEKRKETTTPPANKVTVDAVTIRTNRDGEAVEAIVGPDDRNSAFEALRSLRKDESFALVEAARQYNTRSSEIEKQINHMIENAKALGIRMDENMLRASVTLEIDTRLEDVSLVLPYITQLENAVNRMASDLVSLRERLKGYDQMAVETRRQKALIERLIAEKTARAS
jgi:hypothetical protein